MPRPRSAPITVVLVALCLMIGACGSGAREDSGAPSGAAAAPTVTATADLLLDFTPNAVHSGIYAAVADGLDVREGVRLRIRKPGASTDALRQLETGRADLAVLDIHDLGLARQEGRDVVAVMALVQRPLAAVITRDDVRSPRALAGRRVGVTGLPSDTAVLRSVVEGDGGTPERVRQVTIGFEAVKALAAGRVDAVTAFWNVEGVALADRLKGVHEFRVDDFGAPSYPELVLVARRETLRERRPELRSVVHALQNGYAEAQEDPARAVRAMIDQEPELDRATLTAQMDAVRPAFTADASGFGELDPERLRQWAAWDVRFGILHERPDISAAFDGSLVRPATTP